MSSINIRLLSDRELSILFSFNIILPACNALQQLEALEKVVEKTRSYAPDIMNHCEKIARADHLRYLVRRLVSCRDGITAKKLFKQVLDNHWRILLEEAGKT